MQDECFGAKHFTLAPSIVKTGDSDLQRYSSGVEPHSWISPYLVAQC
jgi:hypothetical protein